MFRERLEQGNQLKGNNKHVTVRTFEDKGSMGTNQHGTGTSTTNRACAAFSIDRNVTSEDNSIAAIPAGALDPVDSVK